jgi:predicted CXXCH cytochrome family protein
MLFGALCAAVLTTAAPGWAGIVNSRHDVTATGNAYIASLGALAEFGSCSACHIPHGAGAERLFPKAPTGLAGGFFGGLCGSCHTNSGFATGTGAIWAQNSVYAASAHGFDVTSAVTNPYNLASTGTDYTMTSTALAYMTSAQSPRSPQVDAIECLSCHDVHNQKAQRPFLMVSLNSLCQICHTARVNDAVGTTGYANTLGTHPSGPTFTGDLNDASGVANNGGANSPIVLGALVVANTDTGSDGSTWTDTTWNSGGHLEGTGVGCVTCHNVHWDDNTTIAGNTTAYLGITGDNNAGANNSFCEYCHQGGAVSGGGYRWNPGTTAAGYYSHPNDDVGSAVINSSSLNLPLGLNAPTSARVGSAASGIVCTSCHGAHRGSAGAASETEPNTPVLLNWDNATADTVCDACHGGAALGFNHHPTGAAVYATSGNTAGNVSCSGGDTEGYTTCHGGGTNNGAAHNRTTPLGAGINTNGSAMCVRCHTNNPGAYDGNPAYTAGGAATHFTGDAATATFGARSTGSTAIRAAGDPTGAANWTGSGLPSKWGANATTIICESCHRLRAGNLQTGDGATRMLVEIAGSARSTVSSTSAAGATQYSAATYLCTGCHLVPAGTHPLLNATGTVYPISGGAGESYTSAGNVNCESCHSSHDAATDSGSYILDGGASVTYGTGTALQVEPIINYTSFCAVCHASFR